MDTDKHGFFKSENQVSVSVCVHPWLNSILSDAAFQAHAQKFLRFDGEFHRQFLEDFLAEAVHDHVHRVLRGKPARVAVKNLVLADLGGRGFMLDAGDDVFFTSI